MQFLNNGELLPRFIKLIRNQVGILCVVEMMYVEAKHRASPK